MSSSVPTYTAILYVGLRAGYTDHVHPMSVAMDVIQSYCDRVGLCVAVSSTNFVYTRTPTTPHGGEPGLIIGFINYPRFPSTPDMIRTHAQGLGLELKAVLGQNRVSVVYPDSTEML